MNWEEFRFADPWWLAALVVLPLIVWLRGRRSVSAIVLPFSGRWRRAVYAGAVKTSVFFGFLSAILLVVALARPQLYETEKQTKSRGYDMMLAFDLSSSMLYEDYRDGSKRINRLQAIKPVLNAFISNRDTDRIGLVAFAGKAYTVAPLTFDHKWLAKQTERLQVGLIEDGTAIGDSLGVAVSRLLEGSKERAGEREGAFIVLLTDGENTAGMLEPMAAAEVAAEEQIKVFTIGAGRNGIVTMPIFDDNGNRLGSRSVPSRVDETLLQNIADLTDGQYFRAESSTTVQEAFEAIDEASKIEFEATLFSVTTELFHYALWASLASRASRDSVSAISG